MDERYKDSVTEYIQGWSQRLTAAQMASLVQHRKDEFLGFFTYVFSLSPIPANNVTA